MTLPFDDVGAGSTVVLLHAGVADRRMWAEHLRPLKLGQGDESPRLGAIELGPR